MTAILMMMIMLVMLGVVLTYFRRLSSFESYIKEHETKIWESLGKLGGIKDMFFPLAVIKIYVFLYKGKFETFNDPIAKQKAVSLKNTITLFFIVFVGLLIFTMYPSILASLA